MLGVSLNLLGRLTAIGFLAAAISRPQSPTGGIEGAVLDPSGAAVPAVAIRVTETATRRTVSQLTNELGRYSVLHLLPGTYTVTAKAEKFATTQITGLVVDAGSVVNGDVALTLGAVEETVTVRASAVAVDTARHVVDSVITENDIQTLPILSRNALDLAAIVPGVTVSSGTAVDPTKVGGYRAIGISGRLGAGTRIQVDGIDVTDSYVGSTLINTSMDTVQEFVVTRSSLDPSAPMTSSGAVSIITKSGGNDLHGRGFFDYANQEMSARQQYEATPVPFRTARAGGMASGPIRRERLFWMAQAERTWSASRPRSVNPVWPELNFSSDLTSGVRYATGRLDWVVTPSVRAFYKFQNEGNFTSTGSLSPYRNVDWANQHVAGVDVGLQRWTHSYRLGYVNFNNRIVSYEPPVPFRRTPQGDPYFLSVGMFALGPNSLAPQSTGEGTLQNNYDGSVFHGRHTVRFGGHVNRNVAAGFLGSSSLRVTGQYNATAGAQVQARGGNPQNPLDYSLASFGILVGRAYPGYAAGHGFAHGARHDTRTSAYIADSFKVGRRLTVNFGVRWEYDTGYFANDRRVPRDPVVDTWIPGASAYPVMPKDLFSPHFGLAWVPTRSGKTVIRAGFLRAFESNLAENSDEPSMLPPIFSGGSSGIGFVGLPDGTPLDIDGKHPRGDYTDLIGRPIADVIGLIGQLARASSRAYNAVPLQPGGPSTFTASRGNAGLIFPGNQYKIPYTLQFNIGVQRELKPGIVVAADYVRHHGIGLPLLRPNFERTRDAATLDPAAARAQMNRVLNGKSVDEWIAANPAGNINSFGLVNDPIWPGLTPNFLSARFVAGGFSLYRGLQVSLRGRQPRWGPFHEVSYFLAYTFSRAEATSADSNPESFYNAGGVLNNHEWNARSAFGPTGFDRTHHLSAAPVMRVPGGIEIGSSWTFISQPAVSLGVPNFGGPLSGTSSVFGTDLNGDGLTDLLPALGVGQFGRKISSFHDLNQLLDSFNRTVAGSLTPHGQALVNAGLFTAAQLRKLGAVVPAIPLALEGNPNPFHNYFTTSVKLQRPVRLERFTLLPFLSIANVFNHAPAGLYGGLSATFGSFNYDYAHAPAGLQASDLRRAVGRNAGTRFMVVGMRLDF